MYREMYQILLKKLKKTDLTVWELQKGIMSVMNMVISSNLT